MLKKPICPDTLTKFYGDCETLENIATWFDCDKKTIRRRAKELGLRHPNSPKQRRRKMDAKLCQINAIARYKAGDSLMELAEVGGTSVDVVRGYLKRKGVKIRTRVDQIALTMAKYGTRFHRNEVRLYVYKRDRYGLVTEGKYYQNNNREPVIVFRK